MDSWKERNKARVQRKQGWFEHFFSSGLLLVCQSGPEEGGQCKMAETLLDCGLYIWNLVSEVKRVYEH